MARDISRRDFLATANTSLGAVVLFGLTDTYLPAFNHSKQESSETDTKKTITPEFPRQDMEAIRSVVGAAHAQFDRVKELVTARPALAKASWDWGFGDWESALGAASHTGRKDIAEFLIEYGARPNLFTFVMLGELDVVKGIIEAMPGIQRAPGPHGITLLQHARNRLTRNGISREDIDKSEQVTQYLESLGDADGGETKLAITEDQKNAYLGRYTFGASSEDEFSVLLNRRGALSIRRGTQTSRRLNLVEPHAFAPDGAPAVRIRFEVVDGRAVALTVHDPFPLVRAERAEG